MWLEQHGMLSHVHGSIATDRPKFKFIKSETHSQLRGGGGGIKESQIAYYKE
jgi:hypothetical protein